MERFDPKRSQALVGELVQVQEQLTQNVPKRGRAAFARRKTSASKRPLPVTTVDTSY